MGQPKALVRRVILKLGRFGMSLILFILLSFIIIFLVFMTGGAHDAAPPVKAARPAESRATAGGGSTVEKNATKTEGTAKDARVSAGATTPPAGAGAVTSPAGVASPPPTHPGPRAQAAEVPRCPLADPARRLVAVSDEVPAREAPSATSRTPRDKSGADRIFDPRADLEILESRPGWVRLRYRPTRWPPGQQAWEGWAMESAIRPAHRDPQSMTEDEKNCLFLDPAGWHGVPLALQAKIREAALRILRQDARCRLIGDGGMMGESQRFYLTCYPSDGGRPYHYWLSAASTEKDFATPAPVDENAAMELCRKKLEKTLARAGALRGGSAFDVSVGAIRSFREGGAYYMTLDYRLGEAIENQAYCFVPPGRDAEITLRDTP